MCVISLSIQNLKTTYPVREGWLRRPTGSVRAVDGVSLDIRQGETLGLVGESGCGKTTLARSIVRLEKPTAGQILFRGQDLLTQSPADSRPLRRDLQYIFQDALATLNPRMTVRELVEEPLIVHKIGEPEERQTRVDLMLERVGLNPAEANRYPRAFSGGQHQRIGIARALITHPAFVIADEPVAALDVSIQAQIVNLLRDLQRELGMTLLFIAHDLSVVYHISDRVAVMYLGKIVELGPVEMIYRQPLHPYTQALQAAIPVPDPKLEAARIIPDLPGDVPSPANPPEGCNFNTRCPLVFERCYQEEPPLLVHGEGRQVACFVVRGSG